MYSLILFFASLVGITFMIGRKLILIKNGQIAHEEETFLKGEYLEELKHTTIKHVKKHSYLGLVTTLRTYVKLSNFLQNKYREIKIRISNMSTRNQTSTSRSQQEINKFLKMVSEYKHKIRDLKHKIHEEEKKL